MKAPSVCACAVLPAVLLQMLYPDSAGAAATAATTPEQLQSAEMAVLQQADVVRQLKAGGMGNSSPEVQQQVQVRRVRGFCESTQVVGVDLFQHNYERSTFRLLRML